MGPVVALGQQRGNGAHADAAAGQAQTGLASGAAQRFQHHRAPANLQVAKVLGFVHAQQHLHVWRQVHVQPKRLVRLQVAPARRQAGVELTADAGQALRIARRQGVSLAHQLRHPGIGSDGFRQQLRAFLQPMLGAVQGHALDVCLFADLQLPERFALVQRLAPEKGEEQRQAQAATDDYPAAGVPAAGVPAVGVAATGVPATGIELTEPAITQPRFTHSSRLSSARPGGAGAVLPDYRRSAVRRWQGA